MFSFKSLLVISCFIMVFSSSDAGVIDDADLQNGTLQNINNICFILMNHLR
uniref:Uncharacterized protein n=1 Tax=Lepeophtheirus salmonis TaxID=72036 RepID=A0A0K2TWX3_LEPSM